MLARSDSPWRSYSCFALFMPVGFVVALSWIVFSFVWLEFSGRRYASDLIGAFIDVYSVSLRNEFDEASIEAVTHPRFQGGDKWPRAIADAFEKFVERTHKGVWMARLLPMSAMSLTLAAFLWHIGSILLSRGH